MSVFFHWSTLFALSKIICTVFGTVHDLGSTLTMNFDAVEQTKRALGLTSSRLMGRMYGGLFL